MVDESNYKETRPNSIWTDMVEAYWRLEKADDLVLPPDGTVNLLICQGRLRLEGTSTKFVAKGIVFIPPLLSPMRLNSPEPIYGIRFKPYAIQQLKYWLRSETIPLSKLKGSKFHYFLGPIEIWGNDLDTCSNSLDAITQFLLKDNRVQSRDRELINYILLKRGLVTMQMMERNFGITRKSITLLFRKNFIHSPIELGSIWQMNTFLSMLESEGDAIGAIIGAGYKDQIQGNKYCKKYLGASPQEVINSQRCYGYAMITCRNRMQRKYLPKLKTSLDQENLFRRVRP